MSVVFGSHRKLAAEAMELNSFTKTQSLYIDTRFSVGRVSSSENLHTYPYADLHPFPLQHFEMFVISVTPTDSPARVMVSYSVMNVQSMENFLTFLAGPSFGTKVFRFDGSENLHEYPFAVARFPWQQLCISDTPALHHSHAIDIVRNSFIITPSFSA